MRAWWKAFWRLLYSDSVEPFVWIYYISLLEWGLYATVAPQPHSFIAHGLGAFYGPWVWVQIPATLSVMVGLVLHRGNRIFDEMTNRQIHGDYPGLWMQVAGHSCMFFVLLAYEVVDWPQRDFSFFAIAPYVLGCFFLMLTSAHKAILATQWWWRQQRSPR